MPESQLRILFHGFPAFYGYETRIDHSRQEGRNNVREYGCFPDGLTPVFGVKVDADGGSCRSGSRVNDRIPCRNPRPPTVGNRPCCDRAVLFEYREKPWIGFGINLAGGRFIFRSGPLGIKVKKHIPAGPPTDKIEKPASPEDAGRSSKLVLQPAVFRPGKVRGIPFQGPYPTYIHRLGKQPCLTEDLGAHVAVLFAHAHPSGKYTGREHCDQSDHQQSLEVSFSVGCSGKLFHLGNRIPTDIRRASLPERDVFEARTLGGKINLLPLDYITKPMALE